MNIELKKVSYNSRLSEETAAYSAQIWVDGKHFADVSNHGQGGSDNVYAPKGGKNSEFHPKLQELEALIKTTYPKHSFEAAGKTHEYDSSLETVCGDLLTEWLIAKDLKRDLSKKIMFEKDGKIWTVKKPPASHPQAATFLAAVKTKNGVQKTLNEMKQEEALAIYKKLAA